MPSTCPDCLDLFRQIQEMKGEIQRVVDLCEDGFRQLGMDGPDRERMGKVWFDTYERFRALLL